MHGWMNESDWLWMSLMMAGWIVVLVAVVVVVVRVIGRDRSTGSKRS
jgi:uncharacterized membrane protein